MTRQKRTGCSMPLLIVLLLLIGIPLFLGFLFFGSLTLSSGSTVGAVSTGEYELVPTTVEQQADGSFTVRARVTRSAAEPWDSVEVDDFAVHEGGSARGVPTPVGARLVSSLPAKPIPAEFEIELATDPVPAGEELDLHFRFRISREALVSSSQYSQRHVVHLK